MACQSAQKTTEQNIANPYREVMPGTVHVGQLRVRNPNFWSEFKRGQIVSWTQDGILLNEIVFSHVEAGQNILRQQGQNSIHFAFSPKMSLNLIIEQFIDALTANSTYHNIELLDHKLLTVSNYDAVKFKITYDTNNNVSYSAWVLFVLKPTQLITIFCSAPNRHYFPRLEQTYLKIIDSAKSI